MTRARTAANTDLKHELGAFSLAPVAVGTAVGRFSVEEAARIEARAVRAHLFAGSGLERIVFAVRGEAARRAFEVAVNSGAGG